MREDEISDLTHHPFIWNVVPPLLVVPLSFCLCSLLKIHVAYGSAGGAKPSTFKVDPTITQGLFTTLDDEELYGVRRARS
jgi:hypothetical protein